MSDVTRILSQIESGDPSAAEQLLPLVYEELRKLAAARLAQEKPGQTLQATSLVHDAYIRLVDVKQAQHWNSRGHFFAAAAEAMRRILVDQSRRRKAAKRGGGGQREQLHESAIPEERSSEELLVVDEILDQLAEIDPEAAILVKLRFFVGLTMNEVAEAMGTAESTVRGQLKAVYAKAGVSKAKDFVRLAAEAGVLDSMSRTSETVAETEGLNVDRWRAPLAVKQIRKMPRRARPSTQLISRTRDDLRCPGNPFRSALDRSAHRVQGVYADPSNTR